MLDGVRLLNQLRLAPLDLSHFLDRTDQHEPKASTPRAAEGTKWKRQFKTWSDKLGSDPGQNFFLLVVSCHQALQDFQLPSQCHNDFSLEACT